MKRGFSLIELLVVVGIVAIMMAIAFPSYRSYVIRSRRSDAMTTLMKIQTQYEQFYAQNSNYPASGLDIFGNPLANSTYYTYTSTTGTTGYVISATAIANTSQAKDTGCTTLSVDNLGDQTPLACWNQ